MKSCMSVFTLVVTVAMCCNANAHDLLGRLVGRGCGCDAAPTCCDTPASCGRGLHLSVDLSLQLPRLRGRGCGGGGCNTGCDSGCGRVVAAPVSNGCGCNGGGFAGNNCGCGNACSGGLLSGFNGFGFGNRARGCGCDAAPACNTGCDTGCDSGCNSGCGAGILGNVRGRFACRQPRCRQSRQVCINVPNFGLIDRLRSSGCGCDSVTANVCDTGCSTGCDAGGFGGRRGLRRAGDCGCGVATSAGCGCDNAGAASPTHADSNGVEPQADPNSGASLKGNPVVDPNAFIIRGARYSGR